MADKRFPTPTGVLDNNLTQLDWARKPLNYRFEIVAMDKQTMNSVLAFLSSEKLPASVNPAANIVARVDLAINPQQYMVDEPARQAVTQTAAGAWVDAYGLGLPKISLSGTTGWNPKQKKSAITANLALIKAQQLSTTLPGKPPTPTGLQDFILLRNNIFRLYAVLVQELNAGSEKRIQNVLQLRFYAWDTQDYFIVLMDDFKLKRSSTRPMMYDYDIPMTVIGYIDQRPNVLDALSQYYGPTSRLQAILNTLNGFISTVQGIEAAIQNVDAQIASDIASVGALVTTLAADAQAVVSGAESFISLPFTFLDSVTLALRQVADAVVSVEQLPQDFINSVRAQVMETLCSVYALRTYPALFQQSASANFGSAPWGNSGCSSTLGVPPSPVSNAAGVSIPGTPAGPNQLPTDMTFPSVPLYLNGIGSTAQPTTISRPKQVDIQDGDTIESIIRKSGGLDPNAASVWQQIATMNGLEYPYIAPNSEFNLNVLATGTVTFYGTPGSVVPIGTRVAYTPPSGTPIYFDTVSAVTLGSNGQGTVGILAEAPGALSNVGPLQISEILDALGNPLSISGVTSVSNTSQTSGGRIWQLLRPGDKILLPVQSNTEVQEPYLDRNADNDQNLFGNDIMLDETGDFVSDATGDLRAVQGLQNMEAAIINRLQTEAGEFIKHSDYGLAVGRLIGEPGDQNAAILMKLEMKSTLLQDARIRAVDNVTVVIEDQEVSVEANVTLIDENTVPLSATVQL